MELLQLASSAAHVALAGVFALLPGTLVWLGLAGAVTLLRRHSRAQALRAVSARLHHA